MFTLERTFPLRVLHHNSRKEREQWKPRPEAQEDLGL